MKVYNGECPCRGCTKRSATCHGECEEYKRWCATGVEVGNRRWVSEARSKMYSTFNTSARVKIRRHK